MSLSTQTWQQNVTFRIQTLLTRTIKLPYFGWWITLASQKSNTLALYKKDLFYFFSFYWCGQSRPLCKGLHDLASVSCKFFTFSHNLVGCGQEIFSRYTATVIGFGGHFLFPICCQKYNFATVKQLVLKASTKSFFTLRRDYTL